MNDLHQAAKTALISCLGLKKDKTLMILTDDKKISIGTALYDVGKELCKAAVLVQMTPAAVNGQEPPIPISAMMLDYDVIVCPTSKSVTHTDARRKACKKGARVATMPNITEDIMIRGLKADYKQIAERTIKVSAILDKGKIAHITTSLGTDLIMPIEGIKAISSTGLILEKGMGGNLPSGESFLMPEEGKSEGILYIDAAIAGIGKIQSQPVKVIIKEGYAVEFSGGPEAGELEASLKKFDKPGMNVAELGVGTNHEATVSGNILEDEKVMGTIHVAFGNNISMGGTCNAGIHIDAVVTKPTVYIDQKKIMENGTLLI